MKIDYILKLTAFTILNTVLFACTSTNTLDMQSQVLPQEQFFAEQLKDIQITEKAAELLATETDEIIIREKLVCRNEQTIGSRFRTKICRTQAELDAIRKNAKRETITAQRLNTMDNK